MAKLKTVQDLMAQLTQAQTASAKHKVENERLRSELANAQSEAADYRNRLIAWAEAEKAA